jgi:uncharacterized cupredoxin-like copper-binding protein
LSRRGIPWLLASLAVVLLTLGSVFAVAVMRRGTFDGRSLVLAGCEPVRTGDSVVQVQLTDAGGMMMGGSTMMARLNSSPTSVASGSVTFVATNTGALNHELLILPEPADGPGTRPVGSDGKIDESASLGEASKSCGAGAGDGITPGTRSWVTVHLARGTYELLCDVPWHYASGMFSEIVVT